MQHHAACFPVNSAPYFVTAKSAKELNDRMKTPPLAFVGMDCTMVIIDSQPYDPSANGGLKPWCHPLLVQDDDELGPNAHGRKLVESWRDELCAWVTNDITGLAVNERLKHISLPCGHSMRGNVMVVRYLRESTCGDYVPNLPIDDSRLAEL